jgi:hypothetical protein
LQHLCPPLVTPPPRYFRFDADLELLLYFKTAADAAAQAHARGSINTAGCSVDYDADKDACQFVVRAVEKGKGTRLQLPVRAASEEEAGRWVAAIGGEGKAGSGARFAL